MQIKAQNTTRILVPVRKGRLRYEVETMKEVFAGLGGNKSYTRFYKTTDRKRICRIWGFVM